MRFSIVLAEQPFRLVFAELVESLAWGLQTLGHEVRSSIAPVEGYRSIILAPHLLLATNENPDIAPGTIVYNGEPASSPLFVRSLKLLGHKKVIPWDYSAKTTEFLHGLGIPARHVPYAWCPSMCREIYPGPGPAHWTRDVDVLFVGSINERRRRLLDALRAGATELRVRELFGVWGPERDAWIRRAKIILNVHYWDDSPSEDLRLLLACANTVAVVSEGRPDEPYKTDWAIWAPYKDLVARVRELAAGDGWKRQAANGFAAVHQFDAASVLRAPVEALT